MSQQKPYFGGCIEDSPKVVMARIVGAAATAVTQATVSAITYRVDRYSSRDDAVRCQNGTQVLDDTALTVNSVIFDTLQTDNDWDADDDGYNFKTTLPATSFPESEDADEQQQWYRIEVWVDPSSGDDFLGGVWILECFATAKA